MWSYPFGVRHHHNKHSDIMQIFPGIQVPTKKSPENYRKHVFSRKKTSFHHCYKQPPQPAELRKNTKNPKETTNGPLLDEGAAPRPCCATGTPAVFFWFRANVGSDSGKCHLDTFALTLGEMVAKKSKSVQTCPHLQVQDTDHVISAVLMSSVDAEKDDSWKWQQPTSSELTLA